MENEIISSNSLSQLFSRFLYKEMNQVDCRRVPQTIEWSNRMENLSPVYTTLNFLYGTDKIGTRTTFLILGLPI